MRYLNGKELSSFHDEFASMLKKHTRYAGLRNWGYPNGVITCEAYFTNTTSGNIFIGHHEIAGNRWWIPIEIDKNLLDYDLQIAFEMCVPFTSNRNLSVHYMLDTDNSIKILHKGKFTVGRGSTKMVDFFEYYRNNPGSWQLLKWNDYDYLVLGKLDTPLSDAGFLSLIESLGEFAHYIPNFKAKFRG
jgi:hypothetical protein